MNNPYVSIVVPFLNADRTLSKCIQSILGQTREDWELILVDDGSTDESAAICQTYSESDKRVKLLKRHHEGVYKLFKNTDTIPICVYNMGSFAL